MILPPQKGPPHSLCRTIPCPWLPHLTQAWIHEAVSLLPTQSPGISFFPPWALTLQAGMPLYTYTCLAWQHLMALGLTCSVTKKREGKERVGTGKGQYVLIQSANQRELGQTQAMWWSQLFVVVFLFPSLPSNFPSCLCPLPQFLFLLKSFPPSRVPMLQRMIPTL